MQDKNTVATSQSTLLDSFSFTDPEKTFILDAGLDFFSKIQNGETISVDDFHDTLFLADEDVSMGNINCGSQAHLDLMNKLNKYNEYVFDKIFRSVLVFWSDSVGESSAINTRFTLPQIKEMFQPFNRTERLALIEVAMDCAQYLTVSANRMASSFFDSIFQATEGVFIGGRILSSSDKHNDLMKKLEVLDDESLRRLALCCTGYWVHKESQEMFDVVLNKQSSTATKDNVLTH